MKINKKMSHLNIGDMKAQKRFTDIDNRGFSLIELIVTIAIMIVFVAVVIISSSVLDTSRVKEVERGIDDFANLARSKSMSVSAMAWYMEVTTDDGEYVTKLCRVDAEEAADGSISSKVTEVDKETYNNKVRVTFRDDAAASAEKVDSATPLQIYFDSSTGKVSKIVAGGKDIDITSGIGYLTIDTDSYDATLRFFYNTGKIERD